MKKAHNKLLEQKAGIKLDIGCGANKQGPDWVGMDVQKLPGVDVVHDLLDFPYPFKESSVIAAMLSHVLEHVPKTQVVWKGTKFVTIHPLIMVMDEIWRIMQPDGQLAIAVPHGASAGFIQDPTHAAPISERTFWYFDPLKADGLFYNFYRPKPWLIKIENFDYGYNVEVVLQKRRMDKSYESGS